MGEEKILNANNKIRTKNNNILFFLMLAITTIIIISINSQNTEAATVISACANTYTCGQSVNVTGYGAVELCDTCFACGAADGVCPSYYSDGLNETNSTKSTVLMKVEESTRPSTTAEYTINFATGNAACASIGGTCQSVEYSLNGERDWQESQDVTCTRTVTIGNYPEAYRAVCEGVPRTASCDECPDPDCEVQLKGIAYNQKNKQLVSNAQINIISSNNPAISYSATTTDGQYSMNVSSGNLVYSCSAAGFMPTQKEIYLGGQKNIIDCPLNYAACSSDCTLPDPDGQNICRANCHEENGCYFQTDPNYGFMGDTCEGVPAGTFITLGRINATHIEGVSCCEGSVQIRESPQFNPMSVSSVKNLITKNYRKELNGVPVTLKILVYDKDN